MYYQNSKKRIQKEEESEKQNIFHIDSKDPEYPSQVDSDNQEVVNTQNKNNTQNSFQGK